MPVETLLHEQRKAFRTISRLVENYKKLGKARASAASARGRLDDLKRTWERCRQLDLQLEMAVDSATREKHPYFRENEFAASEDAFWEAHDFFADLVEKMTAPGPPSGSSRAATEQGDLSPPVALPKLPLPRFSGSYLEWPSFSDLFQNAVTANPTLSDAQRMQYLKCALDGKPAQLIAHLPVRNDNFEVAWDKLRERYSNQRVFIDTTLHSLFAHPPLTRLSATGLADLRDKAHETRALLKNAGRPVDTWGDVFVYVVSRKLDSQTRERWESSTGESSDYPTYEMIDKFLANRVRALESTVATSSASQPESQYASVPRAPTKAIRHHNTTTSNKPCALCRESHPLYRCATFKAFSVARRRDHVAQADLCFTCLRDGHRSKACPSVTGCLVCRRQHHTLLHSEEASPAHAAPSSAATDAMQPPAGPPRSARCGNTQSPPSRSVLLATARVRLRSESGRSAIVRALLDQGSEATLISESLAQTLRCPRRPTDTAITGPGNVLLGRARARVNVALTPPDHSGVTIQAAALVVPKLSSSAAVTPQDVHRWRHLQGIELADPRPPADRPIEVILGADVYGSLLLPGIRRGPSGTPTAQQTIFGWILSGPVCPPPALPPSSTRLHRLSVEEPLRASLERFWLLEEATVAPCLTPADRECEDHFSATHRRRADGRYVVRLPFADPGRPTLTATRPRAVDQLARVERRMSRDTPLAQAYRTFMAEYGTLGHMERVDPRTPLNDSAQTPIYLPHHPVVKLLGDGSVRVRVVFNASFPDAGGRSLNDSLLVGPKLQADIFDILLRWRAFRHGLRADIEKMYRQILVDPRDQDCQRIVWRATASDPIQDYRLTTVTYGTAAAPFLAHRVLQQLADDDGASLPRAQRILRDNFYVDDALFGADSVREVLESRRELEELLARGGFNLGKWAASHPALLSTDSEAVERVPFIMGPGDLQPVLGVAWDPVADCFTYQLSPPSPVPHTKRSILSAVSRIFDPLGWVSPVVVVAKILLQELWLQGVGWDSPLSDTLRESVTLYFRGFPSLGAIQVPRWIGISGSDTSQQLHGFADASNRAYAAAIYLRVTKPDGATTVTLVASKTRVAPLKTVSVPRLELCAATLLARLVHRVLSGWGLTVEDVRCWSDSIVVLAWLRRHPSAWKVFVANRVAEIQTLLPSATWRHVPTLDNPADCASRGMHPRELENHDLWWQGPTWLRGDESGWPSPRLEESTSEEASPIARVHHSTEGTREPSLLKTLTTAATSWPRLLRTFAYVLRAADAFRGRTRSESHRAHLTLPELHAARVRILRWLQTTHFPDEVANNARKRPVKRSTVLRSLRPFVDPDGLLRVGGRLENAPLAYDERHPILLPRDHVTALLARHAHLRAMHGGPQLTLAVLRQNYWPVGGREVARAAVRRCVVCARYASSPPQPLMAPLPTPRVSPSRPFTHSGVDYAGPILIRASTGRGRITRKAYIALFVCLTTRAIHLEAVSDASTPAFLAALHRFVSRRGRPSDLYSDNGRNFRGAEREIQRAWTAMLGQPELTGYLSGHGIAWHFNPPAAPHFGGLWEAGVKSVKYHLRRAIGDHRLTFEELTTVLALIEACVNSRPLAPLSADTASIAPLTPGHFLIGAPLLSVPEHLPLVRDDHLTRWQLVSRLREHFWKRWSVEYLHTLQQRRKWRQDPPNIQAGELVVLKEPGVPPASWRLGRVEHVHPGPDQRVRVVSVRTAAGIVQRPIGQLVPLPIRDTDETVSDRGPDSAGTLPDSCVTAGGSPSP